jgi:hypothetical protein
VVVLPPSATRAMKPHASLKSANWNVFTIAERPSATR